MNLRKNEGYFLILYLKIGNLRQKGEKTQGKLSVIHTIREKRLKTGLKPISR